MSLNLVFDRKLLKKTGSENFGKGEIFRKRENDPDVIFVKSENQMSIDKWGSSVWPLSCQCVTGDGVCGFGCSNDQGTHYKACPECSAYSAWDSHCANCKCRMLYPADDMEEESSNEEQDDDEEEEEEKDGETEDCESAEYKCYRYGGKYSSASDIPYSFRAGN